MKIMKAAQDADFEKLVVAGEPLSKKEQKKLQNNALKKTKQVQQQENNYNEYVGTTGEIPSEE